MPKRTDIKTILVLGAGPIIIGQACEFDYAGTQACKALREEGYRVVLVNSNPATIMTDAKIADATYIEPITPEFISKIIEQERPDALLPTVGGQTALNCTLELEQLGILAKYNVHLLGATCKAIKLAEDRELFRQAMTTIGLQLPHSFIVRDMHEALTTQEKLGFPIIIRPSFTLGGSGSGIAHHLDEFTKMCNEAWSIAPNQTLTLDEALIGWKEFEMEVVRDHKDNSIIVCCIENVDPLGVHTGDSITVAPAITLTDKEYQAMRQAAFKVLRTIGVETGGSNVQFAIQPETGKMVVIEMNPRVSRSSALASKATGFPIAKIAAKLAVGYTLDELSNAMTGSQIPASFEPSLDYVVVKLPRFNFEKFTGCQNKLGTQMHSVGETMAFGRTFAEAIQKAMHSLELEHKHWFEKHSLEPLYVLLKYPNPERLWAIFSAFYNAASIQKIQQLTLIDTWFLAQIKALTDTAKQLQNLSLSDIDRQQLSALKKQGFTDQQLAALLNCREEDIYSLRKEQALYPAYKHVDSCAAEFTTSTSYLYGTYEQFCEAAPNTQRKMLILGSGPNRIGQGIEFDYCCVHAAQALQEEGYETIMLNCNPETVSTDYDCSDRLYFTPLILEEVLDIIRIEKPSGIIAQYGGQTPLALALKLAQYGLPLLGINPSLVAQTEDRQQFREFLQQLDLKQPANLSVNDLEEGLQAAEKLQYPLIVRPSYVLGGRAMAIIEREDELAYYLKQALLASNNQPILLERYLINAVEVDIDAICDGQQVFIPGIMEHIEPAGIHSGDSACCLPCFSLPAHIQAELIKQTERIALRLGIIGVLNIQFAIQDGQIYVLEVNPRASRTLPFISKATGLDLVKIATRCLLGVDLKTQGYKSTPILSHYYVKEAVLPFHKFAGSDPLLGPEMKSTGEVMGIGNSFAEAYAKAQIASGYPLPKDGNVWLESAGLQNEQLIMLARGFSAAGFKLNAPAETASYLSQQGITCASLAHEQALAQAAEQKFALLLLLTRSKQPLTLSLRQLAVKKNIAYCTTLPAASALLAALGYQQPFNIIALQDIAMYQEQSC